MTTNSVAFIFDVVGSQLPEAGIDFLMIGGHAVNHYGFSRATIDVDFMIATSDMEAVRAVMKKAGFSNVSQSENVVFFNKPDIPVRVDFLLVDVATMQTLLMDAQSIEYGGQSLKVPSLPNLIAMKLFALQSGSPKRREKDFPDIAHLAAENRLDAETELKPLCVRFANLEIYAKLTRRIKELQDG
jgi:predicted nucleotidyltransferase